MDLSELKNLIEQLSHRSDLTADFPSFIEMAEGYIAVNLRAREMLDEVTLQEADRVTAEKHTYNLPSDFLEERLFKQENQMPMKKIGMFQLHSFPRTGRTWAYALGGTDNQPLVDFVDTPAEDTEIELKYWRRMPALVNDTDTNELLTNHPTLYVQGSLFYLYSQSQDLELAQAAADVFFDVVESINEQTGRYLGGALQQPVYNLGNFRSPGGY